MSFARFDLGARFHALAVGLRRSPLGAVAALSGLTVRESVRKKVFLILAVFTLVMLGATAMLPAIRAEDRVPLVETWAQRGITFFGVMIVVFLGGLSIPEDIEERKIFTLLAKPLNRWQLLAGRFAGFACLLAAFALATGVISAVFIRIVSAGTGAALANTTEFAPTEVRVEPDGASAAAVLARSGAEKPFEAVVSGPGDAVAAFVFRDLDVDDLPDPVPLRLNIDVQGEAMLLFGEVDLFVRPTTAKVNPDAARQLGWTVVRASDPVEGQPPPPLVARRRFTARTYVPMEFSIPRSWISRDGAVDVGLKRARTSLTLTVRRNTVALASRPHNFEWNFAKGLASTFLLWMVVLALTLAGSTVLSGPVNLLFGLAIFVAGSMVGFLRESLPTVEHRIGQQEAAAAEEEAAGHEGDDHDDGHDHGGSDDPIPAPVLKFSQAVSKGVIAVVPDLAAFDASVPILQRRDVPLETLARSAGTALVYAVGGLLAGLAFLRMREFR